MTEQRLDLVLARLDITVEPDPAFAERLEADLLGRVRRARRFDRSLAGRIARAVEAIRVPTGVLPVPEAWQRVAGLAVLAVLLLVVALMAVFVATRPPDPLSIIERSAAAYQEPPAFDMTVVYADGSERRYRFDGSGRLRADVVRGTFDWMAEGSYVVADRSAGLVLEWSAADGLGILADVDANPLHRSDLAWGKGWSRAASLRPPNCDRWEVVGRESIAGRSADHVRCEILLDRSQGREYWVDVATGLLLRSESVPASGDGALMWGEVTSIDTEPTFGAGVFDIDLTDPRFGYRLDGSGRSLEAGRRYVSASSIPRLSLVAPTGDWATWWSSPTMTGFSRPPGSGPATQVFVTTLQEVTDPVTFEDVDLAPGSDAVMSWIEGHPRIVAEPRRATTVGGLRATAVDFRFVLSDEFRASCPIDDDLTSGEVMPPCQRWFPLDGAYWGVAFDPGDRLRVYAVDLPSRTATALIVQAAGAGPVDELVLTDLLDAIVWLE